MATAEKISVTLTTEMLRLIHESVDAGEFASVSEVLRDAMRAWQRERYERAERLEAIKARIRRSLDDPRPDVTMEELDIELDKLFDELGDRSADAAA